MIIAHFHDDGKHWVEIERFQILVIRGVKISACSFQTPKWIRSRSVAVLLRALRKHVPDLPFGNYRDLHLTADCDRSWFYAHIIWAEPSEVIIQVHQTAVIQVYFAGCTTPLRQFMNSFPPCPTTWEAAINFLLLFRDDVSYSFVNKAQSVFAPTRNSGVRQSDHHWLKEWCHPRRIAWRHRYSFDRHTQPFCHIFWIVSNYWIRLSIIEENFRYQPSINRAKAEVDNCLRDQHNSSGWCECLNVNWCLGTCIEELSDLSLL